MIVLKHIKELLSAENIAKKDGRNLLPEDLSIINDGCIVYDKDEIHWVGETKNLPDKFKSYSQLNLNEYCLTPEIVDSHTHTVFGGDRSQEYSMKLNGVDYQEIANKGGGILASFTMTLSTHREELIEMARERIQEINSYGVGTIEIKSGYGQSFDKEYELSHIIHQLKLEFAPNIQIVNTFLAAHAVPKNVSSSKEYIDSTVLPLLEKLANENIIDFCDIFHEQGYFTTQDVETLFNKCNQLGIKTKIHADEFNDNDGAMLAVKYNSTSCDHLLRTSTKNIKALANSKTVACLLPGTAFFLGKPQVDAKSFLDAGVKVAIGSDYNPGSCHCPNLVMLASIAAPQYKMNMAQMWAAITYNAAAALDLNNQGAIIKGQRPRFSIFKTDSISQITYNWGRNLAIRAYSILPEKI